MAANHLNVYRGPDSVRDYFDPDKTPPFPLIEIPDCLNPSRRDGIRIYAKMMTAHPANNIKAIPALNLLEKSVTPKTDTIVECSSGSTVESMALISRVYYGLDNVHAVVSNKTFPGKLRTLQFFGLNLSLYAGPVGSSPVDDRSGICAARRMAEGSENVVNPDQYKNDNNWKAHVRWTGPQIFRQLPEVNLICAGLGTAGTMTGLSNFFKQVKPSVFRLGTCIAPGQRCPGPRTCALLQDLSFPWRSAIDHLEEVESVESYASSLELCRQGIISGPSSGLNLAGLHRFIDKRKEAGTLSELAGPDGEIHCVFLCCDLPHLYMDEYFAQLGPEHFPRIQNEVDRYDYQDAWELDVASALESVYIGDKADVSDLLLLPQTVVSSKEGTVILDLRQSADFNDFHLPGSVNMPFAEAASPSPLRDADTMAKIWPRLDGRFAITDDPSLSGMRDKRILVVCYDGDTARVATSVMRRKGYHADSIAGGFVSLNRLRKKATALRKGRAGTTTMDAMGGAPARTLAVDGGL